MGTLRNCGDQNNLAQLLTGLERCPDCDGVSKYADHVFLHCRRFADNRTNTKKKFRLVVVPEILVQRMLACQEDRDRGSNQVLVAKNEVERKVTKLSKKGYKRYITKRLKSIVDLTFSTYRFYIFRRC